MNVSHGASERKRPRFSRRTYAIIVVPLLGLLMMGIISAVYFAPWKHTTPAHASSMIKLSGHVPQLISQSQLLGPTDPNTAVTLLIGLRVRDQAGLNAYVSLLQQSRSVAYMT